MGGVAQYLCRSPLEVSPAPQRFLPWSFCPAFCLPLPLYLLSCLYSLLLLYLRAYVLPKCNEVRVEFCCYKVGHTHEKCWAASWQAQWKDRSKRCEWRNMAQTTHHLWFYCARAPPPSSSSQASIGGSSVKGESVTNQNPLEGYPDGADQGSLHATHPCALDLSGC